MKKKFLIIAGTNKAGTTSLFNYLGSHSQIESSIIKQTYFFLDKKWQDRLGLKSLYDYRNGFSQYENFFKKNNSAKYFLESSPDYLYAPNTPKRISDFLKDREGKVIFILRNPVTRFHSFYYFGKQQGLIPKEMSFENYYNASKNYQVDKNTCLMAHKTGFYSKYLPNYFDLLCEKDIYILFFEDLIRNPKEVMIELSDLLKIEKSFYKDFDFEIKNKTIKVRNEKLRDLYLKLREFYIHKFYKKSYGFLIGEIFKNSITKIYRNLNLGSLDKKEIDDKILFSLEKDYKDEKVILQKYLKKKVPW